MDNKTISGPLAPLMDERAVFLAGISGSGKTVISLELARHGFRRLSVDEMIWDRYGDRFASMSAEDRQSIFRHVSDEIMTKVAETLRRGERVVVDSTMCKRFKRDQAREVCRREGVNPVFLYLDVPEQTLRDRLSTRAGSGPNDQIVTPEELSRYLSGFEVPAADETDVIRLRN